MIKKLTKIFGGLILTALAASQVFGAAVTINATGITNHSSAALNGAYVQVIRSADAAIGAPGTDGLPTGGDVVLSTGTVASGTFASGASVPSGQYIYIRVWESWNGTGNPSVGTYYGNGPAENVGTGFVYTYDPSGISTTTQFGVSALNITTTSLPNGTVGTAYSQTLAATGGTTPFTWSISAGSLPGGLSLNASTGVISGTPTTAQTASFTVQVSDAASQTDTQALSITVDNSVSIVTVSGVAPNQAYVGQTIVVSGSGFGADKGTSTITVGGIAANVTAWSDTSITLSVPSGAASGNVVVTVGTGSGNAALTVRTGGVVIDDVEGGSVGNWTIDNNSDGNPDSGYYAFGAGITPTSANITNDGPQASAKHAGALGMRVMYSYAGDWGGGWGATLSNTLDLSSYDTMSLHVKWDGSTNNMKVAMKDAAGHVYATTVSNATLASFTSAFGSVTLNKLSFAEDTDDGSRTPGAINWAQIVSYNIAYTTTGTTANYQNIDSIAAGTVDWGIVEPPPATGEVTITDVNPDAGPAGTRFTAIGAGFGDAQGESKLVFENLSSRTSFQCEVLSWSAGSIEAIVPRLAPAGNYTLKVIRIAVSAGTMQAFESNPAAFRVTAGGSSTGIATIFPNPFNPLSTDAAKNKVTIAYNSTGVTSVGIYIYDMTARLVHREVTSAGQITWDGTDDSGGSHVGDGIYLLRVVNEENKALIAKGKILVIKK